MAFHVVTAARGRFPALLCVPLFIAAACASSQEPTGVLVGLTSGRTLWIAWANDTAALLTEKPYLVVPRDDGMWSAGIVTRCTIGRGGGPLVKDTIFLERTDSAFVTRPGEEPRVRPDGNPCYEAEREVSDLRLRERRERPADFSDADFLMLINSRMFYCGIDSLVITFASPTALSLERRTVGSRYCTPARYSTSGENIVREFASAKRVALRPLLSTEAGARLAQRSTDTLGCGFPAGGRVDSMWSIRRQQGAWVARSWIDGPAVCSGGEKKEEGEPLPHSFTGDAPLPIAWPELVRQMPNAIDAAASPSGEFMLVHRGDTVTLFRPTAGQLGSPLLRVPVGRHELGMIRWATPDETRRWNATLTAPLPRIEGRAEGPVLVLPAEMKRALRKAIPGFRPWRQSDYSVDIVQSVPPTDSSALFAAVGDMNGDGRTDVVVQGHDSTRAMLVALMTEADSVRVLIIEEGSLGREGERGRFETFINLVKRGVIEADTTESGDYNPIPVRIDHEGFEFVYWGKAASFYYWRNGRFVQWITSD
jgi:hypothetical protein